MTNNAKRIHNHLRGDEPLTLDEITHDFAVMARVGGDRIERGDILTALKELEAWGMASCDNGRWQWEPEREVERVSPQRTLF